jgi:hypothetical protein
MCESVIVVQFSKLEYPYNFYRQEFIRVGVCSLSDMFVKLILSDYIEEEVEWFDKLKVDLACQWRQ